MKRRKKGNLIDENFRCDFIDKSGDNWMEFEFEHPKLTEWKKITGKKDIKNSPWYGCCAEDLDYLSRIKVQATIQKHIDHSISSTINLPENTTIETVSKIYEEAWKHGLKGITIYRKNCRTGVILDNTKQSNERPKELPCDVHHVSVKGQKYFVLISKENDKPIECFAGKNGTLDKDIKTGKIVKRKKNFYSFTAEGSDEPDLSPITASMNEMERAISRLLSGLLRYNVDLSFIIRQLEKTGETEELTSFTKCLARVLRHYIKDVEYGEKCPDCEGQLIRKDGCWTCSTNCGYSKCN
jgi:ribonucleoside-diphosphate reductase alpha chain